MRLIASDLYTYWQTSECPRRVYLRHLGEEEAEPGPFEQVIFRLGDQYEKEYLKTFPDVLDLSQKSRKTREVQTIEGEMPKLLSSISQPSGYRQILMGSQA